MSMSVEPSLLVKRVTDSAHLPTRGSVYAAGLDLYSDLTTTIAANSMSIIPTGISMVIPHGYYGRIAPRSGMSVKTNLIVNAGVIDSDYRGEVKIVFQNHTNTDVSIKQGDKVAQLIVEKIAMVQVVEVDSLEDAVSERGANGFGSTGV